MKPLDLTIWNCHQLRRVGAIEFAARINFGTMSTKGRNALLKMVKGAWVTSSAHTGIGLLAYHLLESSGVWFLSGKIRGYKTAYWAHNKGMTAPPGFEEGIARIKEADKVAHTISGDRNYYSNGSPGYLVFHHLKPLDHIPELLAEYVASDAYKSTIAPIVAAIEAQGTYPVDMRAPSSAHFRS